MQQSNNQNQLLNQSNQQLDDDNMPKRTSSSKHLGAATLKQVWAHPAGKVIVIGGSAVTLLFAAGGLFRLLAWTRRGYNGLRDSGE